MPPLRVHGRAVNNISGMVQGQQEMFPGSLVNLMLCPDPGKHAQGFQTPS